MKTFRTIAVTLVAVLFATAISLAHEALTAQQKSDTESVKKAIKAFHAAITARDVKKDGAAMGAGILRDPDQPARQSGLGRLGRHQAPLAGDVRFLVEPQGNS